MPHYDELYPGRFLKATTLLHPLTIRVLSLGGEKLAGDDGEKAKGILRYRAAGADGKPYEGEIVWCKTNCVLAEQIFGTGDYALWAGRLLTIHNDTGVTFGGERVGGIRVLGSPELKAKKTVMVKRPRRKKGERYELFPTDAHGRQRSAAAPARADQGEVPPEDLPLVREPGEEG